MSVLDKLIGTGIKFPISPNDRKGVSLNTSIERINQSLFILFSTRKNTRLLMPEFGSDIYKYRFDPHDKILKVKLKETILKDISDWEPRITVEEIELHDDDITKDNNIIYIVIKYKLINTEVKGNFVYPYQSEVYSIFE